MLHLAAHCSGTHVPGNDPQALLKQGFTELANRWLPILNAFDESGVDLCYEIHPSEDLHDGVFL